MSRTPAQPSPVLRRCPLGLILATLSLSAAAGISTSGSLNGGLPLFAQTPAHPTPTGQVPTAQVPTTEVSDRPTADASLPLSRLDGHWGEAAVGFRWTEDDSRDARWNQTEIGPVLASSLDTLHGTINKAFTVRLGADPSTAATYDLQSLQLHCAWQGGFLRFDPARYGIISPPTIDGQPVLTCSAPKRAPDMAPADESVVNRPDFCGYYLHGERVVIAYRIHGTRFLESPWLAQVAGRPVIARTLRVDASRHDIVWRWNVPRSRAVVFSATAASEDERALVAALSARAGMATRDQRQAGDVELTIPAHASPLQFTVACLSDAPQPETAETDKPPRLPGNTGQPSSTEPTPSSLVAACQNDKRHPPDLTEWTQPGPGRWGPPQVTAGRVAPNLGPYVVDTLTLPLDNPYRALMFVSGHDFFSQPHRMAISTVHGDVWLVDGVDSDLKRLVWRRFATGLFQPLGLRIVRDEIYVLGRDQITRLHDTNEDGEADFYESFNHAADTSAGGHDYSACLETDSEGDFWYVSHRGVHRISADGQTYTTVAEGLRNPNGLGMLARRDIAAGGRDSPEAGIENEIVSTGVPFAWLARDLVTTAPQEGEWTPASGVYEVTPGGYYGYGGPRNTASKPLGYDPPLSWQPRNVDNSTAGQVWVTGDRWGPLRGNMLTFSFGQCRILLQMVEPRRREIPAGWPVSGSVTGVSPRRLSLDSPNFPAAAQLCQAATLPLPFAFESGIMRGRFSQHDGQLYVSGMRGWVSSAVQDGCLQRVRFTGQPTALPTAVHTFRNGLALTYATPLDASSAADPENYSVEAWNYHYRADYGSAEFRPSAPREEGHDTWTVKSAVLLDRHTVFLEIEPWQSVMQLAVRYQIETADRQPMRHIVYHTLNALPEVSIDTRRFARPGEGARKARASRQQRLAESLRPGLLWRFSPMSGPNLTIAPRVDSRVDRLAALCVPHNSSPSRFTPSGPYAARAEGYVYAPWRAHYVFQLDGAGNVSLRVNDRDVIAGRSDDLSQLPRRTVLLDKGFNRLELDYEPPDGLDARLRLLWQAEDGPLEPVAPAALFHDPSDSQLQQSNSRRRGYELATELRCASCHPGLGRPGDNPSDGNNARKIGNATANAAWLPHGRNPAPNLAGIGTRVQPRWLAAWIADPDQLANDHHMPHVIQGLAAGERQQAVADLVAYLVALPELPPATRPSTGPNVTEPLATPQTAPSGSSGDELFIELGCAVCHDFGPLASPGSHSADQSGSNEVSYRTLKWARAKYQPAALAAYLQNPQRHWPATRMPDFRLTDAEAKSLADYIFAHASDSPLPTTDGDAEPARQGSPEAGKEHFSRLGCAACHATVPEPSAWPSAAAPELAGDHGPESLGAKGCVANQLDSSRQHKDSQFEDSQLEDGQLEDSRHRGPRYRLSDAQRADLAAYLAVDPVGWGHEPSVETSRWLVERFQCGRCHDRDETNSLRRERLAEMRDGHVPEALPSLTWTGDKLHTTWIERTLAGQLAEPTRPWLAARMPSFPTIAHQMSIGLSAEHGWPATGSNLRPEADPDRVELGRQLTLPTGLDCRQCHAIGRIQPRGDERTQLARGVAFELVRDRLRPAEFLRYALDPPRYDPTSRMPKLSPDGQQTALRSLAEGNAMVQFQAIWHYLQHFEATDEYRAGLRSGHQQPAPPLEINP